MKKLMLIIIGFVLFCFFIPVIFTEKQEKIATEKQNEIVDKQEEYEYKNYSKIKLLHSDTDKVEELDIDEYLYGVVSAEMPASYDKEALKAQAIVARTYTVYRIENGSKHENADICDEASCCQAWISKTDRMARWTASEAENNWNKIVEAVEETKGKIVTYEGKPINAFFHSNSGGATETVENVWGGTNYPYLQTVQTSRRRCIFSI